MVNLQEKYSKLYQVVYSNMEEIVLSIDACEPEGYLCHAWEECIGSGTAYLYITHEKNYAEQITAQLKDVHDNLGFKRVYFDKINSYEPYLITYTENPDGVGAYDWNKVDEIYDKVLEAGMKPFVMISAIPAAIASDPLNTNFDGGNSSAPKDYKKWKQYCKYFVSHLMEKYGEEEASTWYIQILNEPDMGNIYWTGTHEDFFKTYDYAATAIREVNENIKIGPGGFAHIHGHLLAAFIDHVTSSNYDPDGNPAGAPMDFINGHGYPLEAKRSFRANFDRLNKYMASHFGPNHNKDLIISEWNSTTVFEPRHIRDCEYNAAFIVRQVLECAEEFFSDPDKTRFFSFWTHSDVFDELGEIDNEFAGLYGLITRNGIRKPGYNAFKMLHRLGKSRIKVSGGNNCVNGIATYNKEEIAILVYNCEYDLLRVDGDAYLDRLVHINVCNIPWPKVKIIHYRIDNSHSNSFTVWKSIGSPKDCSEEQLGIMKERMDLELLEEPYVINTRSGLFNTSFKLPMPSVSMIIITPEEKEFYRAAD